MRSLSVLAFFLSLFAFADPTGGVPEGPQDTPGVHVSITPFDGVIPATMANGRTVYKFSVLVLERNKEFRASASTLLQAGMRRELNYQRSPRGWLEGSVNIERSGLAGYRFSFLQNGRVRFSSSGVVQIRPE